MREKINADALLGIEFFVLFPLYLEKRRMRAGGKSET
jgi:hypothetical protein